MSGTVAVSAVQCVLAASRLDAALQEAEIGHLRAFTARRNRNMNDRSCTVGRPSEYPVSMCFAAEKLRYGLGGSR